MLKVLKWIGITILVLVVCVVVLAGFAYWSGGRKPALTVASPPDHVVPLPTDSAAVARGHHLAEAVTKCMDCHGADLGGGMAIDAKPFMRLPAPNLTRGRGGLASQLDDAAWVRAIRHGVAPNGRRLALMPSEAFVHLSDADLGAVIAYVKSVPPVDREWSAPEYGPVARMLLVAGKFPLYAYDHIDHSRRNETFPAEADTVRYGHYLMDIGGCTSCHGPNLAGGPIPGMPPETPPAANLTPTGIGSYTEADFVRILREGKRPIGTPVNEAMPWRSSGKMTDAEIHAVWSYLRTVPPAEFGSR